MNLLFHHCIITTLNLITVLRGSKFIALFLFSMSSEDVLRRERERERERERDRGVIDVKQTHLGSK